MNADTYLRFMSECIIKDPDKESGLRDEEMYGLYLSWCALNGKKPSSDHVFWSAIKELGHTRNYHHDDGHHLWPGLSMTGPAAVDYILSSQPDLI